MATLKLIDDFLALAFSFRAVRWSVTLLILIMLGACTYAGIKNKVLSMQVSALKGEKAEYAALLLTQNAAVKKAGDDMAELQKRAQSANAKAKDLAKTLEQQRADIYEMKLNGTCDEMVQQAAEEVRK